MSWATPGHDGTSRQYSREALRTSESSSSGARWAQARPVLAPMPGWKTIGLSSAAGLHSHTPMMGTCTCSRKGVMAWRVVGAGTV